jgi:4-amino-4-deoxy-L-arabinose transferase-like glycosyltransferase
MAKNARAAYGNLSGLFVISALGLNLLAPRLATLVRTDMPLAFVIFLLGTQIWWKIRRAEPWTTTDRVMTFFLLTSAMLIKGPIVYAFLLPGLITYQVLRRKGAAPSGWSGWWPWILSLAIFLAWTFGGLASQEGFYDSVVVREFAGRFTETIHKPQPIYFYLPHLLHKFAPWSLLLIGLAIFFWRRREQLSLHMQPDTVWLVCWSLGGLVLMSLIPSKRVDRISRATALAEELVIRITSLGEVMPYRETPTSRPSTNWNRPMPVAMPDCHGIRPPLPAITAIFWYALGATSSMIGAVNNRSPGMSQ